MTTTIVFGATADGYLTSSNGSYATARTGSGVAVVGASSNNIFYGQNNNGGTFTIFQAFIGFAWSLPAGERAVSAAVRVRHATLAGAAFARDLELRAYDWGGTVDTGDWRTPTALAALPLYAQVKAANTAGTSRYCYAGSDALLAAVATSGNVRMVAVSSRQRVGTLPTSEEGASIWAAEVADGPALVVTSAPAYSQLRVASAQVQLSDGGWAVLEASDGSATPTILLRYVSTAGVATTVATVPTGTTTGTFGTPAGARGMDLVATPAGTLFVLGRAGDAANSLAVQRYAKGVGATWTAGSVMTAPLPAHPTGINLVAGAYHAAGTGGTIMVCVRHTAGPADSAAIGTNQATYALVNAGYVELDVGRGTAALLRASGEDLGATVAPDTAVFASPANDVGTALDVVATTDTQGLIVSVDRAQVLGENDPITYTWYTLAGDGSSLASTTAGRSTDVWAVKDAAARVRAVRVSDSEAVTITADEGTGYGISLLSQQRFGTGAVSKLGSAVLDGATASMPAPSALSRTALWDAVYCPTDGKVWVYYFDAADSRRLLRTAFSTSSYLPTGEVVQVAAAAVTAPATVKAIRVQRGSGSDRWGLVTVFGATGGGAAQTTYLVDSLNVPPRQPILATRAAFDATAAAVFAWTFSDPWAGDTQSAYRIEIVNVGTGVTVYDSGKTTSATSSHTLAGGTLTNGVTYQWRVTTWDAADAAGPASGYSSVTTAAGGTVTITAPATDNQPGVIDDAYAVQWSVAGTTQAAYRIRLIRVSDSNVLSDSGYVTSTATTATVSGMVSGTTYRVEVTVRNASLVVSNTASRLITPDYGSPERPQITVTPASDGGYVLVQITNPVPGSVSLGTTPVTFDADVAGWAATAGTLAYSTAQAHAGPGSALLTTTGTPTQTIARPAAAATIVGGRRYTARGWVYSPTARPTSMSIDWQGASGYLSTSSAQITPAAGTWTEITVTGTAPLNATGAKYGPTIASSPAAGTQLWFDDLILVDANDLPEVITNLVYRRIVGETVWQQLGTVPVPGGSYRDYTAAAGVTYEYMVRGVS